MSLDTTLITRNRALGAKLETTTGTPISLAAADCGLVSYLESPKIQLRQTSNKRTGQVYLSPLPRSFNARPGMTSFKTELFGSGTSGTPTPSWATTLLACCGVSLSADVATPVTPQATNTLSTVTIGLFQAGRQKRLAGAMGSFKMSGKTGSPVYIDWQFEGAWMSPKTVAIPTGISFPTVAAPRFAGATFSVGSNAQRVSNFEFDAGVKLYLREDPTAVDDASTPVGTGIRSAWVTDRDPVITIDPESLPLTTMDWFAGHAAGTTYAFSMVVGSVAGNTITLGCGALQQKDSPDDEDRSGIMADKLVFEPTGTADAEWSLTFS